MRPHAETRMRNGNEAYRAGTRREMNIVIRPLTGARLLRPLRRRL